jgi:hypothetical protein
MGVVPVGMSAYSQVRVDGWGHGGGARGAVVCRRRVSFVEAGVFRIVAVLLLGFVGVFVGGGGVVFADSITYPVLSGDRSGSVVVESTDGMALDGGSFRVFLLAGLTEYRVGDDPSISFDLNSEYLNAVADGLVLPVDGREDTSVVSALAAVGSDGWYSTYDPENVSGVRRLVEVLESSGLQHPMRSGDFSPGTGFRSKVSGLRPGIYFVEVSFGHPYRFEPLGAVVTALPDGEGGFSALLRLKQLPALVPPEPPPGESPPVETPLIIGSPSLSAGFSDLVGGTSDPSGGPSSSGSGSGAGVPVRLAFTGSDLFLLGLGGVLLLSGVACGVLARRRGGGRL